MNVFLFKIKANSHEYAFRLFQRQIFLLIMKKIIKILKWLYEKIENSERLLHAQHQKKSDYKYVSKELFISSIFFIESEPSDCFFFMPR